MPVSPSWLLSLPADLVVCGIIRTRLHRMTVMSISENPRPITPVKEYTAEKGKLVAESYAEGEALRYLALEFPDQLPPAMYIKQWRRDYPQFDALMKIAESALADVLIEEAEDVAGDIKRPAAHAANVIKVKMARAAAMDSQVYGNKRIIAGDADNPLAIKAVRDLTRSELMQIARGGVVEALPAGNDNEKLPGGRGAPPLVAVDGGAECGVRGTKKPTSNPPEDSVTTQIGTVVVKGIDPGF